MEPIINRVTESDIDVFDLAALWDGAEVVEIDLAPFLFKGLVLREKDFRDQVKAYDWAQHRDQYVALSCSTDAIVPTWAYMLLAAKLEGIARGVGHGTAQDVIRDVYVQRLTTYDWSAYEDRIVVIKGCGSRIVPQQAYLMATQQLQRVARKLMFGEPCSSVPLWRKKQAVEATGRTAKPARPVALKK